MNSEVDCKNDYNYVYVACFGEDCSAMVFETKEKLIEWFTKAGSIRTDEINDFINGKFDLKYGGGAIDLGCDLNWICKAKIEK
jgi:hypothetical protein